MLSAQLNPGLNSGSALITSFAQNLPQNLPQLQDLEIYFTSTKALDLSGGTWHAGLEHTHQHACQDVINDWFLKTSFPHLRHIKSVKITGYVKTATKHRWSRIYSDYHDKGIKPDLATTASTVQASNQELPRCVCKFPYTIQRTWGPGGYTSCQCGANPPSQPELRRDGDCVCYWFNRDDIGLEGYEAWVRATKSHRPVDAAEPKPAWWEKEQEYQRDLNASPMEE